MDSLSDFCYYAQDNFRWSEVGESRETLEEFHDELFAVSHSVACFIAQFFDVSVDSDCVLQYLTGRPRTKLEWKIIIKHTILRWAT